MSKILYNIANNEGEPTSITVFADVPLVATNQHPNFAAIAKALVVDNETDLEVIRDLFDISFAVARKFDRLTDRITVQNGGLYIDGDRLNDVLADTILKFHDEGNDDFLPLVNFLEKVLTNPNEHSREHLYRWLANKSFEITADGDLIAYKSVDTKGNGDDGTFLSISSGQATVNGEQQDGRIEQKIGDVVEMPRSAVAFDPSQGCSTGLHAGSWGYASTFSGNTKLRVLINPRDVVSVPTDSSDQKVRVCRYTVLEVVKGAPTGKLFNPDVVVADEPVSTPVTKVGHVVVEDPTARQILGKLNRDDVRALARTLGVPRGRKNKDELLDDIAELAESIEAISISPKMTKGIRALAKALEIKGANKRAVKDLVEAIATATA